MPFHRVNALVTRINPVFEQLAVEAGDIARGETAVRVDGEEHEANAVLCEQFEGFIYAAQPGEGGQVIPCPEVDDADVSIGIVPLGKLGALVQHVAFGVALGHVPGEHALAVGDSLSGAFFQSALVHKELVGNHARQGQASAWRVAQRVTAFAVGGVQLDGENLLKGIELMFDGWLISGADDDDIFDTCGVDSGQGEREHAAQAGANNGKTFDAKVVKHLNLRARLVVCIDERETASPRLAIRRKGAGAAAAVAAAQVVDADDEVFISIQRFTRANHAIPPAFIVFGLPKIAGLRQGIIVPVGVVTAGQRMEEQDGIALIGIQRAVCLIGKLDIRQGLAIVEREVANGMNLGADGLVHGADTKKDRSCRHRSFFCQYPRLDAGDRLKSLLNALLAEACAGRRALTSLELGIALADHVERTLALHDLAVSMTALHGCE